MFANLCSTQPLFDGFDERGEDRLFDNTVEGFRALATGRGYSTVVFARRGTEPISISPAPHEHERLQEWCQERGVATDGVRFSTRSALERG